jgi:hypothetical protein
MKTRFAVTVEQNHEFLSMKRRKKAGHNGTSAEKWESGKLQLGERVV